VLAGLNAPAVIGFAEAGYHAYKINKPGYKATHGHWDGADVPAEYQLNHGGPSEVARGGSATFTTASAFRIRTARLIHPGSATHVTDVDQRSIALDIKPGKDSITVTVPNDSSLVPSGWYLLYVTDKHHTPSKGIWVHVR
jgi:hypothetical protein